MISNKDKTTAEQLSNIVVKGIQEKKGSDIVMLNLQKVGSSVADYFIICTGNSEAQIDAIRESIEKEVHKETRQHPWHIEGLQNKQWVLLDYVDVVVHIFQKDIRTYFSLEDLWGDADLTYIDE
ncbi:MAG: ribosome silencing factor [Cyclobacteriaceae bacterium]|nr:ribosome silencing factor [Cyclobacteriaceae bacterium]